MSGRRYGKFLGEVTYNIPRGCMVDLNNLYPYRGTNMWGTTELVYPLTESKVGRTLLAFNTSFIDYKNATIWEGHVWDVKKVKVKFYKPEGRPTFTVVEIVELWPKPWEEEKE